MQDKLKQQLPLEFRGCVDPSQSYDVIDAEKERIMCDSDSCLIVPNAEMAAYMVTATNNYETLEKSKNYAYYERNQLVAALSKLFPAWIERHPDSDTTWEDDWKNIIFIELPTGQASWHIHDSEFNYFQHLPQKLNICSWDGHTNEEKYARLAALASVEGV